MTTENDSQDKQLHSALLSAFPRMGELERMVQFGLNENLAAIAGGQNLSDVVFSLIVWATAQGRQKELVEKAVEANAGNPELRHFAGSFLSGSEGKLPNGRGVASLEASLGPIATKRPNRTGPEHALHQKYLAHVIETVGRLTLAKINPNASDADGTLLEEVYVDLPTEYGLFADVKDAEITDWWLATEGREGSRFQAEMLVEQIAHVESRTRPQGLGWQDEAGLRALIAQAQHEYLEQRAAAKAGLGRSHLDIADGVHTLVSSLSTGQIADACRRLVVLGAPGSGKSTFVRHLALCLAGEEQEHWTRSACLARLPGWAHGPLTPVYVELRRFVDSSHFPMGLGTEHRWAEHLWGYIRDEILGAALSAYAPHLEQDLRDGHALLILDGLDEVPYPAGKGNLAKRQQQLRALAASLDDHYRATRIVVASRPYAYENWRLDGYSAVRITPFGASLRTALAANLFRVSLTPDPEQKAERFNGALEQQGVASELADNPLFITLMATLFARSETGESLPTRKGALYRESVMLLLERWTQAKPGAPSLSELLGNTSRGELLARLAGLAYEVHSRHGADKNGVTPEIPTDRLFAVLYKMQYDDPTVDGHGLQSYLSENAGLLISPGHGQEDPVFRFAHRTFQEYLAALHIVEVCCEANYVPVRDHITRQPDLWRLPCLLVGDILHDTVRAGSNLGAVPAVDRLWRLVDHLLDGEAPAPALTMGDPHWWPVWLAASIVEEQGIHEPIPLDRGNQVVRASLVGWLGKFLETARSLPPQERAHCGRVLGLLGDLRQGVGVRSDGLPDIMWGDPVLPGDYPVGGDEKAYGSLPPEIGSLEYSYRLSKYPVTHSQFQCFVDADASGYNDASFWTSEGWKWKGDRRAPEEVEGVSGTSNHPRVAVSWYEALAFCCWLTVRYRATGLLGVGDSITLPTELEWEMAARGPQGLVYPYGDEFDCLKGNTAETGIGQTSAVGIFPDGASPFGVLDMSGNVLDWCLNMFEDHSNDITGDTARGLRGGSWIDNDISARAATRDDLGAPYGRNLNIGFRLLCLPH